MLKSLLFNSARGTVLAIVAGAANLKPIDCLAESGHPLALEPRAIVTIILLTAGRSTSRYYIYFFASSSSTRIFLTTTIHFHHPLPPFSSEIFTFTPAQLTYLLATPSSRDTVFTNLRQLH